MTNDYPASRNASRTATPTPQDDRRGFRTKEPHTSTIDALFEKGKEHLQNGRYEDAIRVFGDLVRQNPHYGLFPRFLISAYSKNGDLPSARAAYDAAAKSPRVFDTTHAWMIEAYGDAGDIVSARKLFDSLLSKGKRSHHIIFSILKAYDRVSITDPKNAARYQEARKAIFDHSLSMGVVSHRIFASMLCGESPSAVVDEVLARLDGLTKSGRVGSSFFEDLLDRPISICKVPIAIRAYQIARAAHLTTSKLDGIFLPKAMLLDPTMMSARISDAVLMRSLDLTEATRLVSHLYSKNRYRELLAASNSFAIEVQMVPETLFNRAETYRKLHRFDQAEALVEWISVGFDLCEEEQARASAIKASVALDRAHVSRKPADYEKALGQYLSLLSTTPPESRHYPRLLCGMIFTWDRLGRDDRFSEQQLVRIHTTLKQNRFTAASNLARDIEDAMELILIKVGPRALLPKNPSRASTSRMEPTPVAAPACDLSEPLGRARGLLASGHIEASISFLKALRSKDPKSKPATRLLIEAYCKLGDPASARDVLVAGEAVGIVDVPEYALVLEACTERKHAPVVETIYTDALARGKADRVVIALSMNAAISCGDEAFALKLFAVSLDSRSLTRESCVSLIARFSAAKMPKAVRNAYGHAIARGLGSSALHLAYLDSNLASGDLLSIGQALVYFNRNAPVDDRSFVLQVLDRLNLSAHHFPSFSFISALPATLQTDPAILLYKADALLRTRKQHKAVNALRTLSSSKGVSDEQLMLADLMNLHISLCVANARVVYTSFENHLKSPSVNASCSSWALCGLVFAGEILGISKVFDRATALEIRDALSAFAENDSFLTSVESPRSDTKRAMEILERHFRF